MKFKLLFLGMLATAVLVSCNNNSIEPGPDKGGEDEGKEVVEGLPIYATVSFKLGGKTSTYAGSSDVASSAHESQIKDAALYIYKSDNAGTVAQCAVYLALKPGPSTPTAANGDYNTVTLKTTSGSKHIYVAANVQQNPMSPATPMTKIVNGSSVNLSSVSQEWDITVPDLNVPLYSTAAGFSRTQPTIPVFDAVADGLIRNFAMNDIIGDGTGTYTGAATYAAFMSNWDGPDDLGGTTHPGGVAHTLEADIDSVSSIPSGLGGTPSWDKTKNQLQIYVQRAYAKVSVKFGFAATNVTAPTTPSNLAGKYYVAAVDDGAEGRFFPWGSGTDAYWSLGNITTAELPFQQYVNGIVQDMFYANTNDSIKQLPTDPDNWFINYDNTRVFPFRATPAPAINTYPHDEIIVDNTKSTMLAVANRQVLTGDAMATQANYKYTYATENARQDPVAHDHAPYAILGGFYQPKNVLTSINRANVSGNSPILAYNKYVLLGTEGPGTSHGKDINTFNWTPVAGDSLYYLSSDKIFIFGKANLMAYYAWGASKQINRTAGQALVDASQVPTAQAVYNYGAGNGAEFGTDVATAINNDIKDKVLFAYFEGQCFYRIWIQNKEAASTADQVAILRNHIYDVNITKIKGPGIADPNQILVPGQPVLEQETYVSVTINVLDWHKVDQDEELENK